MQKNMVKLHQLKKQIIMNGNLQYLQYKVYIQIYVFKKENIKKHKKLKMMIFLIYFIMKLQLVIKMKFYIKKY